MLIVLDDITGQKHIFCSSQGYRVMDKYVREWNIIFKYYSVLINFLRYTIIICLSYLQPQNLIFDADIQEKRNIRILSRTYIMQAARKHSVFFSSKENTNQKSVLLFATFSILLQTLFPQWISEAWWIISNPRFFTLPQTWINNLKKIIKKELIWTNIKLLIKLNLFLILDLIIKIQVFSSFHNYFFFAK